MDVKGNEETILPFISNYQLNVFDYHEHDSFEQFHSELQSVFEFLRYAGDKEELGRKLAEHKKRYEKLSDQAKRLLASLTNIKEIPNVGKDEFERGEFDMCKAFEDMKEEGRIEGKASSILELLEDIGPVPLKVREEIMAEKNEEILKKRLRMAAHAESVEEFMEKCHGESVTFEK